MFTARSHLISGSGWPSKNASNVTVLPAIAIPSEGPLIKRGGSLNSYTHLLLRSCIGRTVNVAHLKSFRFLLSTELNAHLISPQ